MQQTKRLIRALAGIACLFAAACANPADTAAPTDTGGLAARDIEDGGLTLYWDAVPEADSYRIYWSEGNRNPESAQVVEFASTDTAYTLGNLNNGAAYYFWVLGVKDGLPLGAFKEPLEVTLPVPAPDAAGIVLARDLTSIHLLWKPVSGASSYEVWYSLVNRVGAAQKWAAPVQGTRAEVTGLLNNNTYYFWLKSLGAAGPSPFSGVRSETTGEPLEPSKPEIQWTGRLRNAMLAIWEPSANATGYEFRYSVGNNADTAEYIVTGIETIAYMAEGLVKGMTYNFWVRSCNTIYQSEWSDMGTITVGQGLPAAMEGTFFSRYPYDRPYYMDGYRIGPVLEMRTVFPFNKAKYPQYEGLGLPGSLAEAGMVKEGAFGGEIHNDDQYVFYINSMIGIVRAVLERPYLSGSATANRYYSNDNYVVIEPFMIPGSTPARYEVIEFRYKVEDPNHLMGINNGPAIYQANLDMEVLQSLSGKNWDAGVAYPGIRLGFLPNFGAARESATVPDKDGDFHPELLPPGPIGQYLAAKQSNVVFSAWNEDKGIYNWQDREQFPAEELMEYVFW